MNLDELKEKWTDYDRKLDTAIRLNEARVRMLEPKATLQQMSRLGLLGLLVNGIAALWLGTFIAAHVNEPQFFWPAVILHAGVVAHIAFAVRQWLELKTVDYGAPVVTIQKRLAALRLLRIRVVKWTLWLSPLLWTPFLIVSLKGALGVDAYHIFPPSFLVANLGFGAASLALMIWMARHFADRFKSSPRMEQVLDHLAGRSLVDAMAGLSAIADFEREQTTV